MSGFFSNLPSRRLPDIRESGEIAAEEETEENRRNGAGYQSMIIDPLLLSSRLCTLIQSAHTRMFRIDVIRQFRVKVGGRSRFSPMRIVLVSIPLLLAPIFLAPGGGNGKPSKYLDASIYPRVSDGERKGDREREKFRERRRISRATERQGRARVEKGRGRIPSENSSFVGAIPKSWTGGEVPRELKDRPEESRPAYRDY